MTNSGTQIITWNDFGESHYIGPIRKPGIPRGAEWYVENDPHDGWRALLPHYIDQYKYGNITAFSLNSTQRSNHRKGDIISYWYRRNPAHAGSAGGTTGNNPAFGEPILDPAMLAQDKVFVSVLVTAPSDVHVQIGNSSATLLKAKTAGVSHFSVPFNGRLGSVRIVISKFGHEITGVTGPEITENCYKGYANWNAFAGSSLNHDASI